MMDYQTNPEAKPERFATTHAAGAVVIAALLLLVVIRHGLRGLI